LAACIFGVARDLRELTAQTGRRLDLSIVEGSRSRKQKTGGRKAGTPNKTTALLKDAILQAAQDAGGKAGMIGYLTTQAEENPAAFMTLLGKVLPLQIGGVGADGKITVEVVK
jgi:hypothetical protein